MGSMPRAGGNLNRSDGAVNIGSRFIGAVPSAHLVSRIVARPEASAPDPKTLGWNRGRVARVGMESSQNHCA